MLSQTMKEILDAPYALSQDQIDFYVKYQYIKLKHVFDEATIQFFNEHISAQVAKMNRVTTALKIAPPTEKHFCNCLICGPKMQWSKN